jgi:hypothetical protein
MSFYAGPTQCLPYAACLVTFEVIATQDNHGLIGATLTHYQASRRRHHITDGFLGGLLT